MYGHITETTPEGLSSLWNGHNLSHPDRPQRAALRIGHCHVPITGAVLVFSGLAISAPSYVTALVSHDLRFHETKPR